MGYRICNHTKACELHGACTACGRATVQLDTERLEDVAHGLKRVDCRLMSCTDWLNWMGAAG